MREPMAAPKTTKYNEVEITGAASVCSSVYQARSISYL